MLATFLLRTEEEAVEGLKILALAFRWKLQEAGVLQALSYIMSADVYVKGSESG
jgi:hypothetical protein